MAERVRLRNVIEKEVAVCEQGFQATISNARNLLRRGGKAGKNLHAARHVVKGGPKGSHGETPPAQLSN